MIFKQYGSYSCLCYDGFRGQNCEVDIDECFSSPCLNGGICLDGNNYSKIFVKFVIILLLGSNSFECDCSNTGYHGDLCEFEIDECVEMQPCVHNSSCVDLINDYHCICHHGYVGHNCSVI